VTFKDVTLDVISKGFKEVTLTVDEITELTKTQVNNLDVTGAAAYNERYKSFAFFILFLN
jgi:hypothetical protein